MTGARYSILLYHGVHDDDLDVGPRNSSGKHIARARFEHEIADVAANHPVVSMRAIAAAHRGKGSIPDDAVAVTFDDGFANNAEVAWPVLEAHGVPATIYLATGYIGCGRMMWSDRLEATFLGSRRTEVVVEVGGREMLWPLGDLDERVRGFTELKARCKELPDEEKLAVVDAVTDDPAVAESADHPLYAFMTWEQVKTMAESPLIDFGAHTVDHVSLPRVERSAMRDQIDRSIAEVSARLGRPCDLFAYPEGQEGDVDDDVIAHLQAIGLTHAPMAVAGDNQVGVTDPFRMHRTMSGFEGMPYPL